MKSYESKNVRNVVLLGSPKSGKTTLVETMMFEGKVIDRRGTIEAKNTMSDNTEIEQIYQRSIYSTLLYTEFKDTKGNTTGIFVKKVKSTKPKKGSAKVTITLKGKTKQEKTAAKKMNKVLKKIPVVVDSAAAFNN